MLPLIMVSLATLATLTHADPKFGGENVCNKTITVRRDKTVDEPVKYELEFEGMCGILPCTKKRVEMRIDSKIKTTWETMNVAVCCDGYAETPDRKCAPICLKSCRNGNCIKPGVCQCSPEPSESTPGFVGSSCNRFVCLAPNKWGSKCDRECDCPPNSYCSANSGECLCRAGWRGANCTEECEPSMNCDDVDLPPISEPDSNIIPGYSFGRSQKLEALASRSVFRDDDDDSNSSGGFNAANISINLFLIGAVVVLIYAVMCYKKRLDRIRAELYYGSSSGRDSTYSAPSTYSCGTSPPRMQNRPRMPTPPEADLLGKNMNFASATRHLLLQGILPTAKQQQAPKEVENKFIVDPKVESHLVSSQRDSQQNIYSDVQDSIEKSFNIGCQTSSALHSIPEQQVLNICTKDSIDTSHYQVPRSPAVRAEVCNQVLDFKKDAQQRETGVYENDDQNLYEEIKPKSPSKE